MSHLNSCARPSRFLASRESEFRIRKGRNVEALYDGRKKETAGPVGMSAAEWIRFRHNRWLPVSFYMRWKCRLRLNEGVLNVKTGCGVWKSGEEIPLEDSQRMDIVLWKVVLFKYNRHLSIYRVWCCYIKWSSASLFQKSTICMGPDKQLHTAFKRLTNDIRTRCSYRIIDFIPNFKLTLHIKLFWRHGDWNRFLVCDKV